MTEQQEPEKLNAYQVMKNFRKLAADDTEYFAVAVDYLDELNELYKLIDSADPKAADVKAMIDEIVTRRNDFDFISENPG